MIYEENHSFDNLYGTWGTVGRDRVDGLAQARRRQRTQVAQNGSAYRCLLQADVNLTSPPLADRCADTAHGVKASAFTNGPWRIDRYIGPEDKTCPPPTVFAADGVRKNSPGALPGGCTRDLVHRFYQEQYQLNDGRQNRYVTGSDAVGLTMGHYDTRSLPIYDYLHGKGAPHYVLADHFFQAAFGGSFLNHQYLIAARAPEDTSRGAGGAEDLGAGRGDAHQLPAVQGAVHRGRRPADPRVPGRRRPWTTRGPAAPSRSTPCSPPARRSAPARRSRSSTTRSTPTSVTGSAPPTCRWNWYSGGWDAAAAGHPGPLFQYHHQPFNYFAAYAPGQPGRAHLQDEKRFLTAARRGTLPTVSFVKPYGAENEHPGYASEPDGSDHLVDLLKAVTTGPQAKDTLVVVTYDEFGGQWDHVAPPGQGTSKGVHDAWGPGTRIPALLVSASMKRSAVDHHVYDTTSILATIERSLHLKPVATRDARVADLGHAIALGRSH